MHGSEQTWGRTRLGDPSVLTVTLLDQNESAALNSEGIVVVTNTLKCNEGETMYKEEGERKSKRQQG